MSQTDEAQTDEAAPEPKESDLALLRPEFREAFEKKGYSTLTLVQQAVLAPENRGRDLRISSRTGSGKTLALGFAIADVARAPAKEARGAAKPFALVLTPTRELAAQVREELSWLFSPLRIGIAVVAGGASYTFEARALSRSPGVVVATPGRLIDYLKKGSIATDQIASVVLDEADQMLDLGFRDELTEILGKLPEARRTHLVSATFSREVIELARRYQQDPVLVEGSLPGSVHEDIEHIVHVVRDADRKNALVNLLLAAPDEQTLIFARTRAEVGDIADELIGNGFQAAALSGEMSQEARNRSLKAFRARSLQVLVATDVAARGIDVRDITRVIHLNPPGHVESYVHRSGRTGRAGRKGKSVMLISPAFLSRALQMMARGGIKPRIEPVPSKLEIFKAADERLLKELSSASASETIDSRILVLANRLLAHEDADVLVARLIERSHHAGPTAPREFHAIEPRVSKDKRDHTRHESKRAHDDAERGPRDRAEGGEWSTFRINWGSRFGADPRRMLGLVCRRGDIRGADVGAIRILEHESFFDVSANVAEHFLKHASQRDARDPGLVISAARPQGSKGERRGERHGGPSRAPTGHRKNRNRK